MSDLEIRLVNNTTYKRYPNTIIGNQLGSETFNDLDTAGAACNALTDCIGFNYSVSDGIFTLRTGIQNQPSQYNRTVVTKQYCYSWMSWSWRQGFHRVRRCYPYRVVRNVYLPNHTYLKQVSSSEFTPDNLDDLIPDTQQITQEAEQMILNNMNTSETFSNPPERSMEGTELINVANNLIEHQDNYINTIHTEHQNYNSDRESLNTKYLSLMYEIENQKDAATFYAIQRNLVLTLVLLVLLVRNDFISQKIGMLLGGFIAIIMAGYYVFSTYYNTYRRDPLNWYELSTDIEKQAPPSNQVSCPFS
jgi:hypothetical protein